jgi:hypothetical protein
MRPKLIFLYMLIASVAISAVVGIGVLLIGDFGSLEIRVLMTTLTVTVTSILGLACGAYFESGRWRALPLAGIVLAIAAAVMTFFIIWDVADDSEIFLKSTATVTLLALSCSHLSLLSLARLDKRFAWSRIAAFFLVWLLSAILLLLMWFEPEATGDLTARVIGVLSILIGAVTVMTPVFHKLSTNESPILEIDAEIEKLKTRIAELETRRATLSHSEVTE